MGMGEHTQCCVVGGGPAGIVLGLLLARGGVSVTVLEKHADFFRDFRGDTVHPQTLELLDELGLGEAFARLPAHRLQELRIQIDATTLVLVDLKHVSGRHRYIAMVPQWDLLNLLAESAAEEPTFTLRMESAATGLLRDAAGRVTGVRYTDADGAEHELEADLTVGCDGRWSVVREAAGMRVEERDAPMDVWQVRLPKDDHVDERMDGRVFQRFGGGQAAVTMDRGDYYQVAYLIAKGTDAQRRRENIEDFRERLGDFLDWPRQATQGIRDWDDVKLLEVRCGRVPRWYDEGVLCIGDAAHPMSPSGGVGVNMAVADAVAAARILAEPLRRGERPDTATLAKVQKRRQRPLAIAQRVQEADHNTLVRPALDGTLDARTIPLPLRMLDRFPALHRIAAAAGTLVLRPEHAPDFARR